MTLKQKVREQTARTPLLGTPVADATTSTYGMVPFDEVCTLEYGASLPKKKRVDGPYPVVDSNGVSGCHSEYLVEGPAIVVGRTGSAGEVWYVGSNCFPLDTTYYVRFVDRGWVDTRYLYYLLKTLDLAGLADDSGLERNVVYERCRLPVPSLEAQLRIVAEVDSYQRVIDDIQQAVPKMEQLIQETMAQVWGF